MSRATLLSAAGAAAFLGAVALAAVALQRRPEGPVIPIWDREACAHCHMHVGEPGFAAQLQTKDGRVHHYDDPGCLLLDMERLGAGPEDAWFHHASEERWLPGAQAAFASTSPTPMGYGVAAVELGTPGAEPLAAARARLAGRRP